MKFCFYLEKSGPANTGPAGPAPTPMYIAALQYGSYMLYDIGKIFVSLYMETMLEGSFE